jgi:hypothetical protein
VGGRTVRKVDIGISTKLGGAEFNKLGEAEICGFVTEY